MAAKYIERVVVFLPAEETMAGWYPGWQMAVAWLVVTAVAATMYFSPMTRLIESFGD